MTANNENPSLCSACGGKCCLRMPGIYHPDDLGKTFAEVVIAVDKLLRDGTAQIDWWEGDEPEYFVRPTALDWHANDVRSPTWGGRCALLTDKGCALSWDRRPHQCRGLIPNPDKPGECDEGIEGKRWYVDAWKPWQTFLANVEVNRVHRWPDTNPFGSRMAE